MHILQINSDYKYGSTGRIVSELKEVLQSRGNKCTVAYGRKRIKGVEDSDVLHIGKIVDNYLHVAKTRIFDAHGFSSGYATKAFIKKINEIRPDIIHLHNLHGYYIHIGLLFEYLKKLGKPVVWTLHDCWPFTGHCAHYDYICCQKWKKNCYDCQQKKTYPTSLLIDRSRKNYQLKKMLFTSVQNLHIVAVSNWLSANVKQSFLANYPIHVIANGIDINTFSPKKDSLIIRSKYGIGNRFMLMGVATVWTERKGLKDYIELSKIIDNDSVIVLVGLSEIHLKSLPKEIIGIPRTNNIADLAQLYSSADIILNLSVEESFGLTTVEGFSSGTPGIVYNCTASPELITPETGVIVNKGDIKAIIKSINTIKENRKASYSKACRERAERLYNKEDRYMDYLKLYESVLRS